VNFELFTEYRLLGSTKIFLAQSAALIEAYYQSYQLKSYISSQIDFARDNGYVQTVLGRRGTLKTSTQNAIVRGGAERNAVNAPIQEARLTLSKSR
jgi:DNA polymerase-1